MKSKVLCISTILFQYLEDINKFFDQSWFNCRMNRTAGSYRYIYPTTLNRIIIMKSDKLHEILNLYEYILLQLLWTLTINKNKTIFNDIKTFLNLEEKPGIARVCIPHRHKYKKKMGPSWFRGIAGPKMFFINIYDSGTAATDQSLYLPVRLLLEGLDVNVRVVISRQPRQFLPHPLLRSSWQNQVEIFKNKGYGLIVILISQF